MRIDNRTRYTKKVFCLFNWEFSGVSLAVFLFVRMTMIDETFCFFQVKMEYGIGDPFELGQPNFCKSPKSLDPIQMNAALENPPFD